MLQVPHPGPGPTAALALAFLITKVGPVAQTTHAAARQALSPKHCTGTQALKACHSQLGPTAPPGQLLQSVYSVTRAAPHRPLNKAQSG